MIRFVNKVVLVIGITLLFSCEGGTTYTKTVYNQSSETLSVTVHSMYGDDQVYTINSNESEQIYWDDQMGSFADDSYNCTQKFDSLSVTITNDKILGKDIMNPDNWLIESTDGRNSREDCTFIIEDSDIE